MFYFEPFFFYCAYTFSFIISVELMIYGLPYQTPLNIFVTIRLRKRVHVYLFFNLKKKLTSKVNMNTLKKVTCSLLQERELNEVIYALIWILFRFTLYIKFIFGLLSLNENTYNKKIIIRMVCCSLIYTLTN